MPKIRPFDTRDLDSLYAISLATGLTGADASMLYKDPKMIGHIYSAPYALLEPDLTLIIEDEEGVAGFVVGAVDTYSWESKLELEWWPLLRRQYIDPSDKEADSWTSDQRRSYMIHHPTRTPFYVTEQYPAHLHLNLLPRLQKKGFGTMLFEIWLTIAKNHGAEAVHVGVNRDNTRAIHFWKKQAFKELMPDDLQEGRTLWLGRR